MLVEESVPELLLDSSRELPPVAVPLLLTPKCDMMLCFQVGCDISGQLLWLKEGAA